MHGNKAPDLLIHNASILADGSLALPGWVQPGGVQPGGVRPGWLQPGFLAISDGRISAIGSGSPPEELQRGSREIMDARGMAALPGLTNAHTHLSQTFMRGLAGGRALLPWLQELIWPLQAAMSPEETRLAALLGLVENLRCGATHVINNHKVTSTREHTDAVLSAAEQAGLRFTLARGWADRGKIPEPAESILADLERLLDQWKEHPSIRIANGPIAVWRCSAETLQQSHALAKTYGSFTHIHTAESRHEVDLSLDEYNLRPVEWLDQIGVVDEDTQLVHCVWLDDNELSLLAESRAAVIHCPVSNAILGSGVAPISAMLERNIPVLLGTDGPASNDTQDIWETMKAAVSLARITGLDPTILPPQQALSLVLAGKSLRTDAPADLILVDTNHTRAVPVHDLTSALVLGTHGSDVDTVICGGEILMKNKQVLILDEQELLRECTNAVKILRNKAGID